jgi:hypothetical protein
MDLAHFDVILKYSSDITLGGVLLIIIRILYGAFMGVLERFQKLIDQSLKNCQEGAWRMDAQANATLQSERKAFEENRKWERDFFLALIEEKNAQIEAKEAQITLLLGFPKKEAPALQERIN